MRLLAQAVMESEVTKLNRRAHGERDPKHRLSSRKGYRERRWDTRVGTLELAIPRVRDLSSFPSLLAPRPRAEHARLSVVQGAYVAGVSARRVEDLVEADGGGQPVAQRGLPHLHRPRYRGGSSATAR